VPRPRFDTGHEGVRRIMKLMIPALFGVSVSQINLALDTVLASFLPTGSVSWLYYAERLTELPLGVIGIAVATVILPGLSKEYSTESETEFRETVDWAIKMILMIGVPASLALMLMAEPILITLFQYGELGARDVEMAALSLRAMAFGLPAFMLIKVLATAFYSRQDTQTPVSIGIKAMIANMGLNLVFVIPLHLYWQIGHVGLSLATMASAYLNTGLLLTGLMKREIYRPASAFGADLSRIFFAAALMACGLWFGLHWLEGLDAYHWWERVVRLLSVVAAGLGSYFVLLMLSHPGFLRRRPVQSNS